MALGKISETADLVLSFYHPGTGPCTPSSELRTQADTLALAEARVTKEFSSVPFGLSQSVAHPGGTPSIASELAARRPGGQSHDHARGLATEEATSPSCGQLPMLPTSWT